MSSVMSSAANANSSATAQAAFDKALELVRADHPSSSITTKWLQGAHTITDVEDEVRKAKLKYEAKPKGWCRKWLGELSLGIMHYASILDALVQHHPEYVSLAWGTTKLLFVVSGPEVLERCGPANWTCSCFKTVRSCWQSSPSHLPL
jgi:hypothetical protein